MTLALNLPPQPESPLRALDPRWKLASLALAVTCVAVLQTVPGAALAWLGTVFLVVAGRVPGRWYLSRLLLLAPFLGLLLVVFPFSVVDAAPLFRVGPLAFSALGFRTALLIALKAVAIVSLVYVLLTAAPLHVTLHAAHALRVPGSAVLLVSLAYRYGFLLADELTRIRIALRVRGYRNRPNLHSYRTVAHVGGTLLVHGHERGERVSDAMRCRGFDGRFRSLTEFRTTAADVVFFSAVAAACLLLVAAELGPRWE